ncbi:hypothetical protein P9939_17475, partial [Serratia nevei]
VILVGLAIDQIAQSGLSSLSVIYYSAQLFRASLFCRMILCSADSPMHCPRIQSGVDIARAITYQIRQTPHLREAEPL